MTGFRTGAIDGIRAALNHALRGQGRGRRAGADLPAGAGHLLVEDLPGLGKTTLAKAAGTGVGGQVCPGPVHARLASRRHHRVPHLQPEHSRIRVHARPRIRRRASGRRDQPHHAATRVPSWKRWPSVRSQWTTCGTCLSGTFFVIATQNPVEQHGTYPLPEAQLDRFAMKLRIGYPEHASRAGHARGGGRPGVEWRPARVGS